MLSSSRDVKDCFVPRNDNIEGFPRDVATAPSPAPSLTPGHGSIITSSSSDLASRRSTVMPTAWATASAGTSAPPASVAGWSLRKLVGSINWMSEDITAFMRRRAAMTKKP